MKRRSIAALIALACSFAFAQAGYNGAAKSFVTQFWRSIDKIDAMPNNRSRPALAQTEIKVAATHLRNTRKRDPALDVRDMEDALARVQGLVVDRENGNPSTRHE
ncbi:MAG: hypothetical protein EAZ30_16060 [Betaproteobacteria bacterium]|nr:MAG: hypothetical protein EAZ43_03150 [Betaproteobacteria bacterium]TAG45213.1 MAG: hypothetical protein EAZ30_16060 [Betaproteobacteria bacterium]